MVLDGTCVDIVEERVDRDVPPQGVLEGRAKFLNKSQSPVVGQYYPAHDSCRYSTVVGVFFVPEIDEIQLDAEQGGACRLEVLRLIGVALDLCHLVDRDMLLLAQVSDELLDERHAHHVGKTDVYIIAIPT